MCYLSYIKSVSFIEIPMNFCIYDKIHITMIKSKKINLLHFKLSKLGQILHVHKTGFLRPTHIYGILKNYKLKL